MPEIKIFLDSSALIAGIISSVGAARALLLLSEDQKIRIVVSEQVITETERNLAKKIPQLLPIAREMILASEMNIQHDPSPEEIKDKINWIHHPADLSILVAASKAQVDFLVTLNTKHFIDDPKVSITSGLRIGTPGDCLGWIRQKYNSNPSEGINHIYPTHHE